MCTRCPQEGLDAALLADHDCGHDGSIRAPRGGRSPVRGTANAEPAAASALTGSRVCAGHAGRCRAPNHAGAATRPARRSPPRPGQGHEPRAPDARPQRPSLRTGSWLASSASGLREAPTGSRVSTHRRTAPTCAPGVWPHDQDRALRSGGQAEAPCRGEGAWASRSLGMGGVRPSRERIPCPVVGRV